MSKAIRYATLAGALLLGAGCENQSGAPGESTFIPRPKFVSIETAASSLTTRVTGYAVDPEAFFLSIAECGPKCAPPIPSIPPIHLDNSPLFLRSVVRGAQVTLRDLTTRTDSVPPVAADPFGTWVQPKVPSADGMVLYPYSTGAGALPAENIFPVLTPVPPGNYLPTVALRPVTTSRPNCQGIEVNQISDKGILEAVAKFLTVSGTPTTVNDLINPSRYAGVTVFWLYLPGFQYLRAPAGGTTIEATSGTVLNVDWAPPGLVPPAVQSERGFFVNGGAPVSSMGISVVLLPADTTGEVTYSAKDPVTDAASQKPWTTKAIKVPVQPGVITFGGIQLDLSSGPQWTVDNPNFCRP